MVDDLMLRADLDVQVVATVGPHLDPSSFRVPANAVVNGLPIVCVPLDRDQPHNASLVAAAGAGVVVNTGAPLAAYRGAIDAALRDAGVRAAAERLAGSIPAIEGAPADAVESLLP